MFYIFVLTCYTPHKSVPSWFDEMFLHSCSIFSDGSSEGSKPSGVDKEFVIEGRDIGQQIRQAPYRVNVRVSSVSPWCIFELHCP